MCRKLKRGISIFLYNVFATNLPDSAKSKTSRKIRYFFAKNFTTCGKNVNFNRKAQFLHDIIIGDNSGIGANSILNDVQIGKNVMMGPNVCCFSMNHRFQDTSIPMIEQGFSENKTIIIDDDVWIGAYAILLPGVHIGKGSIIGAGSVVTHDVPEFSIACGNPAKVVKKRK